MSRVCSITGKKSSAGSKRSHSCRKTKRTFRPNLFYKNIKDPETGLVFRIRISAKGLKILKKKGIV